jgi:hypothetical protein
MEVMYQNGFSVTETDKVKQATQQLKDVGSLTWEKYTNDSHVRSVYGTKINILEGFVEEWYSIFVFPLESKKIFEEDLGQLLTKVTGKLKRIDRLYGTSLVTKNEYGDCAPLPNTVNESYVYHVEHRIVEGVSLVKYTQSFNSYDDANTRARDLAEMGVRDKRAHSIMVLDNAENVIDWYRIKTEIDAVIYKEDPRVGEVTRAKML